MSSVSPGLVGGDHHDEVGVNHKMEHQAPAPCQWAKR